MKGRKSDFAVRQYNKTELGESNIGYKDCRAWRQRAIFMYGKCRLYNVKYSRQQIVLICNFTVKAIFL
jgi:hypothetical protein